jgi:cell division septation protein DedD
VSFKLPLNSPFYFSLKQIILFVAIACAIGALISILAFLVGFEILPLRVSNVVTRSETHDNKADAKTALSKNSINLEIADEKKDDLEVISPQALIQKMQDQQEVDYSFYEKLKNEKNEDRINNLKYRLKNEMDQKQKDKAVPPPSVRVPENVGEKPATDSLRNSNEPVGAGFTIQVNSFRDKYQAEKSVERLKSHGYPAFMVAKLIEGSGLWYRVRVGRFISREEAEKYALLLRNTEKLQPFITGADN